MNTASPFVRHPGIRNAFPHAAIITDDVTAEARIWASVSGLSVGRCEELVCEAQKAAEGIVISALAREQIEGIRGKL